MQFSLALASAIHENVIRDVQCEITVCVQIIDEHNFGILRLMQWNAGVLVKYIPERRRPQHRALQNHIFQSQRINILASDHDLRFTTPEPRRDDLNELLMNTFSDELVDEPLTVHSVESARGVRAIDAVFLLVVEACDPCQHHENQRVPCSSLFLICKLARTNANGR